MKFYNKIKWILGISLIFGLVLTTNLIDRNNFIRVKDSIVNIYEDRLVAKFYIYEITNLIHDKELAILKNDTVDYKNNVQNINQNISSTVSSFEKTKLTSEEAEIFQNLKDNLKNLEKVEARYLSNPISNKADILNELDNITSNLNALSKIQITEGSRQMSIGKQAIENVKLFTEIEIYFLVFLAILIQIIILYNPKSKNNNKE